LARRRFDPDLLHGRQPAFGQTPDFSDLPQAFA
jgi:hypothetical protein